MAKIKIVKQRDLKDCGACSLSSIISYYGGYVPLEKIRLDTNTNKDGVSALNLINAAKKYGFDSKGIQLNKIDNDILLPAIAHIITKSGLEHFVVIYKISKKRIYIMDPSKGKISYSYQEFYSLWTNVIILFYPKVDILKYDNKSKLIKELGKIVLKDKKLLIYLLLISILVTFLTIINSYYFKITLDSINNLHAFNVIKLIAIFFGFLSFVKFIFSRIRNNLELYLEKNLSCNLFYSFIGHLFSLPESFLKSRTSGEIISRVHDLLNVKNIVVDIFVATILDMLLLMLTIPVLYYIDHDLFLILLFIVSIYFSICIILNKFMYKKIYQNIEKETSYNSKLLEDINMMISVKNMHKTDILKENNYISLNNYLTDSFSLAKFINFENNIKLFFNEFINYLIYTLGFILIFKEKLSVTYLITFTTLMNYFLEPIKSILIKIPQYNFIKASIEKIDELMMLNEEELGKMNQLKVNKIAINNLEYSYDNYHKLINNFNLQIKDNHFILLKGRSGSGKSTLCNILMKNIDNYQGVIKIDSINLKDISINTIRNNIIYISQNENLFTGTIRDNITLYQEVSEEKFQEICKLCFVNEIVDKKPLRYETIITNESTFISGGERQRIILARALLNERNLYLIDEALSEVDYKLEQKIILNLKKYLNNKIVIYVTHKNHEKIFNQIVELN